MIIRLNEDYDFNKSLLNKGSAINKESFNYKTKDIDKITQDVNAAIHKTDTYWLSYKSVMTRTILPLKFYRTYLKQYDDFVNAVKHYYFDDNFSDSYLFLNLINSLKNSSADLERILSDELFNNISYAINKLINYIKTNFLGDHYI